MIDQSHEQANKEANKEAHKEISRIADLAAEQVFRMTIGLTEHPDFKRISSDAVDAASEEFRSFLTGCNADKHDIDIAVHVFKLEVIRGCKRRALLIPDGEGSA